MREEDIKCYLGREVKLITSNDEAIFGILSYENGFYKISLQKEPQLKPSDIKNIYYLKS